jgi:hypothetical protein
MGRNDVRRIEAVLQAGRRDPGLRESPHAARVSLLDAPGEGAGIDCGAGGFLQDESHHSQAIHRNG